MDSVKSGREGKSEALPAKSNLSRQNDGQLKHVVHPTWLWQQKLTSFSS